MRVLLRGIFAVLVAAHLSACASDEETGLESDVSLPPSETAIEYEAVLEGLESEEDAEIAALLTDSLSIFRLQDAGAPSPAFLTRRLQADESVVQTILKSEGYYLGEYAFEIVPPMPAEGETEAAPDAPWTAIARVNKGEEFTLVSHKLILTEPAEQAPKLDAKRFGSPIDARAVAAGIVGAESAAVARLRETGFYYAVADGRRAVADLEQKTIEVESRFRPGPFVRYGETVVEGAENVDHDFLRTYRTWQEGEPVRRSRIDAYQRELSQTGIFSSVTVRLPESPDDLPADGVAPITVTADERLPRSVTAGVRMNSDTGPAVRGTYLHRNILGAGESLRAFIDLSVEEPELGFDFRKPQFYRNEQALLAGAFAGYRDDDVYTGLESFATLGIERRVSRYWRVGAGGSIGYDNIEDDIEGVDTGRAYLLGLPVFAEFDDSNDLLNPTSGFRMLARATPYTGTYDDEPVSFFVTDVVGSTYYDILGDKRWVLAGRGRVGSIISGELETISPTKRLYSGGGGSVRGYQRDFIGPIDDSGSPTGGQSVVEAGLEIRGPITGDIGWVGFFEGGTVSSEVVPNLEEDVQWATGLGFRYYSPVGPVRLDIGFPINGRDVDNSFEFYFAIGQAF